MLCSLFPLAESHAKQTQGFNSRVQEADGSYTCLPAYQLPPPHPEHGGTETCNALSTVRGYLLVSHGARMSVFNTTADAKLLFTKERSGSVASDDSGGETEEEGCGVAGGVSLAPPWTVLSSYSSGEVLVAEAKSCSVVSFCLGILRSSFSVYICPDVRVCTLVVRLLMELMRTIGLSRVCM